MHGSGGDWSTPRRSSKSKKKLQPCWVSRWRRQTATTSHDGSGRLAGDDSRSDRRCLRGPERVTRQRLPSAYRSGSAVGRASAQAEPTARAGCRGTSSHTRPSARAAFCRPGPPEIYAILLDEGVYHCSIRTMYRILAANQEVRERRDHLRHPAYKKPELLA